MADDSELAGSTRSPGCAALRCETHSRNGCAVIVCHFLAGLSLRGTILRGHQRRRCAMRAVRTMGLVALLLGLGADAHAGGGWSVGVRVGGPYYGGGYYRP